MFPESSANTLDLFPKVPYCSNMNRTDEHQSSEEMERIGATLRTYREMRGWTPDEFANQLRISRPYLANIEAGRKRLTPVLLARASAALDVRQIAIMRSETEGVAS